MPVLAYGVFLNTIIEFLIVAFVIFHDREAGEPDSRSRIEAPAPTTKDVPGVLHGDSSGRQALPGLHFGSCLAGC